MGLYIGTENRIGRTESKFCHLMKEIVVKHLRFYTSAEEYREQNVVCPTQANVGGKGYEYGGTKFEPGTD